MGKITDDLNFNNAVNKVQSCLSFNLQTISNLKCKISALESIVEKQNSIANCMNKRVMDILEINDHKICDELTEAQRTKRREFKASALLEEALKRMQFELETEIEETLIKIKTNVDFINKDNDKPFRR
jgi:hypothetical protein